MPFSQANKQIHATVASHHNRAFRIDALLAPFFTPLEIRNLRFWQARISMLISGSQALQFLNRRSYRDSDLDLRLNYTGINDDIVRYLFPTLGKKIIM